VSISFSLGNYIAYAKSRDALHESQTALLRVRDTRTQIEYSLCLGQRRLVAISNNDRKTLQRGLADQRRSEQLTRSYLAKLQSPDGKKIAVLLNSLITAGRASVIQDIADRPRLKPVDCKRVVIAPLKKVGGT